MTTETMPVATKKALTLEAQTLEKLVLSGDLSGLTSAQKIEFYNYRCGQIGVDPSTKPLDFIKLPNGKEILYANKECSAQLSSMNNLSVNIVKDELTAEVYRVQARVTARDGRTTDDMGAVWVKGIAGQALCDTIMKGSTKAKRRAILSHCGTGLLDETEARDLASQEEGTTNERARVETEILQHMRRLKLTGQNLFEITGKKRSEFSLSQLGTVLKALKGTPDPEYIIQSSDGKTTIFDPMSGSVALSKEMFA